MPNCPKRCVCPAGWWLLVCLAAAGCGARVQMAPVHGKVLYQGQPLKFGSVMFQPSQGQPASGVIQADGTFTLSTYRPGDGAPVGTSQVRVTCYEGQNPAVERSRFGESGLGNLLIPERFTSYSTSDLSVDVPPEGKSDLVLDLGR